MFFGNGAEAVAAFVVEGELVRDAGGGEGGVENHGVVVIDDRVILAGEDEKRRSVRSDVTLEGQGVPHHLVVHILLAEKASP